MDRTLMILATASAPLLHQPQPQIADLDSTRQSQIERSEVPCSMEEYQSRVGKGDGEDRFGEVAASPNPQFVTAGDIAKKNNIDDHALLAPAHSCTFCAKDRAGPIVLRTSFLIWQAKEWGLEFGSKSLIGSVPGANTQTFKQKLFVSDFSWSPGFKIDFGFNLPYDGWDVNNRWTFYHGDCTNLKKHLDLQIEPPGYGIVPLWHYPFFDLADGNVLRFQNAAGNWRLYLNSFDINLGRSFTPVSSLLFRMNAGAKGCWIRQYYHVDYSNSPTLNAIIQPPAQEAIQYLTSRMAHESKAWGLGPRGGLESKWKFGWGFSLAAEGAFSCLATYLDLNGAYHDLIFNQEISQNENFDMKMREHEWELIPLFEGTIGLDWGTCFGKTSPVYFGITIAYEMQYWWSQNHARRNFAFQSPGNMWDMRGDLQMQGLTASIRSDF